MTSAYKKKPMKPSIVLCAVIFLSVACHHDSDKIKARPAIQLIGTWKLLTGTIIEGNDTTITDYTVNQELIKIINSTHFAFLRHDLGKDSTQVFVAGGGRCKIKGNRYTEHLDFCNYRAWENNTFEFEYRIVGDTLTTTGREKVESLNVDRLNIERYVRIGKQQRL